jgi:catechol 2,3-dioxygenase-like lactoylglutathione lyase family enzyme
MSITDVVQGFHDVTILAHNVAELCAFYSGLGFRKVIDRGDEFAVFLVGKNELAIHTAKAQPLNALVLSVLVDDLEPIRRQAAQLGIQVAAPVPLRPDLVGFALLDPNGNKLEFLQAVR